MPGIGIAGVFVARRERLENWDRIVAFSICVGIAFTGWGNGPTIGFKLGGAGDVTASNRLWLERQPQRIGSGVVVDGLLL